MKFKIRPGIDFALFGLPLIGHLAEYIVLLLAITNNYFSNKSKGEFSAGLTEIASLVPRNIKAKTDTSANVYVICRNLGINKHSGVVNWLWLISLSFRNSGKNVHIISLSNEFKDQDVLIFGIHIHYRKPILNPIYIYEMPLVKAWTESASRALELLVNEFGAGPVIGVQAGLESAIRVPITCRMNLLLVTNHKIQNLLSHRQKNNRRLRTLVQAETELILKKEINLISDSKVFVNDYLSIMGQDFLLDQVSIVPVLVLDNLQIPSKREKVLVFIGRRDKRKNLSLLIDCWERINSKYPEWQFVVYGERGNDFLVEQRLHGNCIPGLVLGGSISEIEKQKILRTSSIAVIPSTYESFGIVAVEAMKGGCPVLASNVGGLRDTLVDRRILFDPNNADSLVQILEILMNNDHFRNEISSNLLNRSKDFSLVRITIETEGLIKGWLY
jgi:glycosyltransferase involved in cell wall biosynthesis